MIVFEKWIKTFIIKTHIKTKALSAAVYNKNLAENACINSEHYMYLIYQVTQLSSLSAFCWHYKSCTSNA